MDLYNSEISKPSVFVGFTFIGKNINKQGKIINLKIKTNGSGPDQNLIQTN